MIDPAPLAALLARRDDLTEPAVWELDDTERLEIARECVALHRDLWQAVRGFETANCRLDEQAAARRRVENRRCALIEGATTDAEAAEQAARHAAEVANDCRGRVRLRAEAQGLTYLEDAYTDADGYRHERRALTAPAAHPALTDPAAPGGLPIRRGGSVLVSTLNGDTLEAVESWLGLPNDPAAGGPPPLRYHKQVIR